MTRPGQGRQGDGGINGGMALVVIVAMVVTGVLALDRLGSGDHKSSPATVASGKHGSSSSTTTAPVQSTSTTTLVPAAQIKVQVLNGLRSGSLAGRWNTKLKTKGYMTGPADDATVKTTVSAIYVLTPGYQPEAQALAATVGLPVTAVNPTVPPPATAPIPSAELKNANLVLVVGNELAAGA